MSTKESEQTMTTDLGDLVIVLLAGTLSGLRDRLWDDGFPEGLLLTRSPATASVRYRALKRFFTWAEAEGEIEESPMARMRPPKIPEKCPQLFRPMISKLSSPHARGRRSKI